MTDVGGALLSTALLCGSSSIMIVAWYLHLNYATKWTIAQAILCARCFSPTFAVEEEADARTPPR
jgi:uncharacterized protein (DUF486 family)